MRCCIAAVYVYKFYLTLFISSTKFGSFVFDADTSNSVDIGLGSESTLKTFAEVSEM